MRVKVKICGITLREDLDACVEAGADAVGFVVGAPLSPRNLSLEGAEKLIEGKSSSVEGVLVTVPKSVGEVVEACSRLKLNIVQIHGNNYVDDVLLRETLWNSTIVRAVNANSPNALSDALRASRTYDAVILDSCVRGQHGGTGLAHDWELSNNIRAAICPKRMILAGGLTPENVAKAVRKVRPFAVDVSSGVELRFGVKSHERISEFVENAKSVEL